MLQFLGEKPQILKYENLGLWKSRLTIFLESFEEVQEKLFW